MSPRTDILEQPRNLPTRDTLALLDGPWLQVAHDLAAEPIAAPLREFLDARLEAAEAHVDEDVDAFRYLDSH